MYSWYYTYLPYSRIYILTGIKFGGLLEKGGKSKLADINLAVTGSTKYLMMFNAQSIKLYNCTNTMVQEE